MSTRFLAVLFAIAVSALAFAEPHQPRSFPNRKGGPSLAFAADSVALSGASANATLYVASVSLGSTEYQTVVLQEAGAVTSDANGAATYTTARPLETRSIWIAVNGATGGYTVAAPRGMLLREMDFPGNGLGDGAGALRRFALAERYSVEAILVRPGTGMWRGHLRDGETLDGDHTLDGAIDADVSTLAPVGDAPAAPDRMMPGDLLMLIDRVTLEYHVAVLGR